MPRILEISVCFFLTINCYGQTPAITESEKFDIRQFEIWTAISENDILYADYRYLDSLEFLKIKYQSDTLIVEGFVVAPKYTTDNPIIIFNRGGNRNYYNISERTLVDWIAPLAQHGFSVFASQYRSNDEFGGSDINDVLNLMEAAKNYPNTDSTRIGMVGWSRGGLMTYIALTLTNEIDCAIIGGAPTDMTQLIKDRPEIDALLNKLIPNYEQNRNSEIEKRSPILWADKLNKTDLLIIHGKADERVSYAQATEMSEMLDSLSYTHKLTIIDNDDHILRNNKEVKDKIIANWLTEKMKIN